MVLNFEDVEAIAGLKYKSLDDRAFADAWFDMSHNAELNMSIACKVVEESLKRFCR